MKTEREYVESAKNRLRRAEALIGLALGDISSVEKINFAKGDAVKMNAASMAKGMVNTGYAALQVGHAEATNQLLANWPDFGADVVVLGPGR